MIPGLGRSLGEENVYPLKYSCLEYSMHRGAWQATVHEVAKSQIVKQAECKLSNCDAGEDESPLDCKEIKPINPKGNQSWIFI